MIVQLGNEKVSNHGSIPITIDCNVVAFIVFEEGFHQPIKRTKQSVSLDNVVDDILWKVDNMIKANRRITIVGVAEELGIGHEQAQKIQSPEFFLEGFLKLIK
ncbi:hypothetical protein TNCV_2865221 [Trichonephila clavipes]|nr:hypothetical protein TNCV_2865221 [Trichonephila clavipes]